MPDSSSQPIDTEAVRSLLDRALNHVAKLASGEDRWKMSIPAQPDWDSDLVISRALDGGLALLAALEQARREAERMRPVRDAIVAWFTAEGSGSPMAALGAMCKLADAIYVYKQAAPGQRAVAALDGTDNTGGTE